MIIVTQKEPFEIKFIGQGFTHDVFWDKLGEFRRMQDEIVRSPKKASWLNKCGWVCRISIQYNHEVDKWEQSDKPRYSDNFSKDLIMYINNNVLIKFEENMAKGMMLWEYHWSSVE